ncbi:aspartyl protease family protein [Sphingobacterium anhuiense]|uniref:Aspartyl protease family protein n=1 Tax=Sphingobacterium anhuiense TaxID=493780 RepID=A0ABW5YZS6_9SPHI
MKKYILTILSAFTIGIGFAQPRRPFDEQLQHAFLKKDHTDLVATLADNFAVAGHTGTGAQFRLQQIIKNYPAEAIAVISNKKTDKGQLYAVEITEKGGKKTKTDVLLNSEGKLVHITLFDQLYGMKRATNPRLRAVIPFENKNGSIYLQVKINDFRRPLNLLFDTGADGMAVSQQLADELGLKVTRENNASMVGGNAKIKVSDQNTIQLDTLHLSGQGIAIFPEMGREGDGLIGNSLIRQYITHIDYDKNVISLYDFGDFDYKEKGTTVPVSMPSGVMIVPGQLDIVAGKSHPGQFVFDTGASYDLICFRPFVRKNKLLVSGFKPEAQASTVSMGISSPTFIGRSHQFAISPLPAMSGLPITLMGGSSQNENWNPGADGSIGVRLISRYNMTINLAANEIHFSPNKLHGFPQDFILKTYQFGWDNQGKLKMLGTLGGGASSELKPGAHIVAIGSYSVDQLQKKPALIAEIQGKESAIHVQLEDKSIISI